MIVRVFISQLESKIPTNVVLTGFTSNADGVSLPASSTSWDGIADFIIQLKSIDCIADAYVSSVTKNVTEGNQTVYNFTATAVYVDTRTPEELGVVADETTEAE